MTTHTEENPSTSLGSPEILDAAATASGDIKVEKIEDDFGFLEDDEMYQEEELEDVKLNYEETELSIKEELENQAWDAEEIVKNEPENEEKKDFPRKLKEKKKKVVVKEELLTIEEEIEE